MPPPKTCTRAAIASSERSSGRAVEQESSSAAQQLSSSAADDRLLSCSFARPLSCSPAPSAPRLQRGVLRQRLGVLHLDTVDRERAAELRGGQRGVVTLLDQVVDAAL